MTVHTIAFAKFATKTVAFALASIGLVFAAPAAIAAAPTNGDQPVQVTVGFADLDLSTAKGQSVLAHRISRAADEACAPELDATDRLAGQTAFANCRERAVNEADAKLAARALAGHLAAR